MNLEEGGGGGGGEELSTEWPKAIERGGCGGVFPLKPNYSKAAFGHTCCWKRWSDHIACVHKINV